MWVGENDIGSEGGLGIEAEEIENHLGNWGEAEQWARLTRWRLRQPWENGIGSEWILGSEAREVERSILGIWGELGKWVRVRMWRLRGRGRD